MMTDTEIRLKGLEILARRLGDVEAERFIALMISDNYNSRLATTKIPV
jgi:hypothetical protein